MKVIIAKNDDDMKKVRRIRTKVFIDEQQVPPDEEWDEFEQESVHLLAYAPEGEWVGAGRVRYHDGIGKAERICVLQEFRGSGIGQDIMQRLEAYVAEQGGHLVKLNAQTHAKDFYERIGYDVTSGEFLDAGIPHVAMEKRI